VDEEVGTDIVGGIGVDKIKANVLVDAGVIVAPEFTESGVDADSVANRFKAGVGADVPRLQARSASKSPIQIKSRLFILFLNCFKVKKLLPAIIFTPLRANSLITKKNGFAQRNMLRLLKQTINDGG